MGSVRMRGGMRSPYICWKPAPTCALFSCCSVIAVWHHPHLHCVVPGGGLSPDGTRWVACRPGFFLPVRVLSRLFRRLFLQDLMAAYDAALPHADSRIIPTAKGHELALGGDRRFLNESVGIINGDRG
jgi:Putative transposase